jgi:hypothetical protein
MDRPISTLPKTDLKLTDRQLLRTILATQRDLALLLSLQNVNTYSSQEAKILAKTLTDFLQGVPK